MPQGHSFFICAVALLVSAKLADANVGESPIFELDTRDSNSTHVAESGVFALDTRFFDGLSDDGTSSTFILDTRTLHPQALVVDGPVVCPVAGRVEFRALAQYSGGWQEDVTSLAVWTASGAPLSDTSLARAAFSGNHLTAGLGEWATPVFITARYRFSNGQVGSATHQVTIGGGDALGIGIGFTHNGAYLRPEGGGYVWRITASAYGQAVSAPGVTWQWKIDGVMTGSAANLDVEVAGAPRTVTLTVTATDGQGRTGTDKRLISLQKPALNEPGQSYKALQPAGVAIQNTDGDLFEFDATRTSHGLLVLVHGMTGSPNDDWIRTTATAITARLLELNKPVPNIAIFGWEHAANPILMDFVSTDTDAVARALKVAAHVYAANPIGGQFFYNITTIKGVAPAYGIKLADWIKTEATNGHVDLSKPIHLIGHSAGGFVIGTAAEKLKTWNTVNVARVTMLDTPLPFGAHLTGLAPTVVERVISSYFGACAPDVGEAPLSNGLLDRFTPPLSSTAFYERRAIRNFYDPLAGPLVPTKAAHSYAHQWFLETVRGYISDEGGFDLSPFMSQKVAEASATLATGKMAVPPSRSTTASAASALTGFSTFGSAAADGAGFVLTEDGNSGIQQTVTLPIDAETLRFRYQFTAPGDGDFIVVYFGDNPPLFIGPDALAVRANATPVEVPLAGMESLTGTLVIKLVSQGQINAAVRVDQFELVTNEDPDHDGLTIAQEQTAGTDPLLYDSDGDGLSDPAEMQTYFTNPNLDDSDGDGAWDNSEIIAGTDATNGQSFLRVTDMTKNVGGTFTLRWPSQAGRFYNVQRSADVSFATFEVVGQGLSATLPQNTFVDTVAGAAQRMFYRVEAYVP